MLGIYQQILERNARETDPFVSIHEANATLLNQVDSLQEKCVEYERDIASLQQQLDEGGGGAKNNSGAATAALKNETRLREKLEKLQEELNSKLTAHAEDQAEALKTAKDLSDMKDLNQAQESTITNLKKENDRKEKAIEHLTEQLNDAQARTKLAEQQYVGLKETIRSLQKENDDLKKENSTIESRLVQDKGKMSDEMNVLTEMVDSLKREVDMLRSLKKQEEKRKSGGWFGRSSTSDKDTKDKSKESDAEKNSRKFGMLGVIVPSGPKQVIHAHTAEATSVRYDSMGTDLLVTGGSDSLVKVWDVGTGGVRATLRGPSGHVILGCDMCGHLVAGAFSDKTCRVWNMRTERMIHHLVGHAQKVTCVRLFDNGQSVISGSADRSLKVWDIRAQTYRQNVTLRHSSTCNSIDAGSNGVDVVSGHHDGGLRFWDVRSGERTMDISGLHESSITSVQFNPADSTQVLTNGLDSCLKLVDIRTGAAIHTFRHQSFHTGQSWSAAALSSNGAYAAAGSSSTGTIFVWNTDDGELKAKLEQGHNAGVCGFAWGRGGASGQQVASIDRKGTLVLWA
ncbi:related protein 16-1 [Seminavis robusta]|uniref:Related protein 16-1 n=1 Tax=Seminavis robusta TaxID=568900 RepID=A0A9N8H9G2_9STRA|nr:related protein 16-1 [Seminavis robusta]|eukprot:Sro274_g105510.1 related protein 16-1 (569) ;mRNA; f:56610-58664